MTVSQVTPGTWAELRARHLGVSSVVGGGVLLVALNIYVVASLLPTVVGEIGGEQLYAWNTSLYVVAMVTGSTTASWLLARCGSVTAYRIALGGFAVGSVICGLASVMPVLLAGRVLQGLGGGVLHGLGFVMVQKVLPERLWPRGMVVISSMFAAGNFVGPAIGGLFAQYTSWRYAFAVVALAALLLALVVKRVVPDRGRSSSAVSLPVLSLMLIAAATAAISVAGILRPGWPMAAIFLGGVVLTVAFLGVERRTKAPILSKLVFARHNPLKWLYLTTGALAFAIGIEAFLPLFGQRLAGMPPVAAGFFGAALALGWTGFQLFTGSVSRPAITRAFMALGPAVLALGLALHGVLLRDGAPVGLILLWAASLLLAGGGIALAMPHLGAATMAVTSVPDEATRASAGIATVLNVGNGLGAAVAGLLVNLGAPSTLDSAHYLLFTFALICVLGTVSATLSLRA